MGGGDPNFGSSNQRGAVDDARGNELNAQQRAHLESLGRALDEAHKQARDNKVDPALLKDLGMTPGQFAAFVEEYRRRFGQIKKMLDQTDRPDAARQGDFALTGARTVQDGRAVDRKVGMRGTENLTPDQLRKLYESRASKVSREYRKAVDAYFRAISEAAPRNTPASAPAR